jgi:DNA-binding NarL/FixJ family response regulator
MNQPLRILIADSDIDFAKRIKKSLDRQPDIQVVDIVRDGQGAVNRCREVQPDLVLMDLHLPVLDSVKAIQHIIAKNQRIRVLTTSTTPNDRYAIEAIKAGASGYIEKSNGLDDNKMARTIRQVAEGEVTLNPALAALILNEFHRLTAQELQEQSAGTSAVSSVV